VGVGSGLRPVRLGCYVDDLETELGSKVGEREEVHLGWEGKSALEDGFKGGHVDKLASAS
jgi:hypothetical protein